MSKIGQPARDYIRASDEKYFEEMAEGSTKLRHAIEDYYIAKAHRFPRRAA